MTDNITPISDAIEVDRTDITPVTPDAYSYDPEAESSVQILVTVGTSELTIRQSYARGSRDEHEVLKNLTHLAEQYVEEGRVEA